MYKLIQSIFNKFFIFFYLKNTTFMFYKIIFYFIVLYENFYHSNYKISRFYIFFSKLNSEQNFFILMFFFIFIVVFIYFRVILIYFIYTYIFYLYLYKNINFLDYYGILFNMNKNLTNGLLTIHPVILYFSYGYFLYVITYLFIQKIYFLNYNLQLYIFKKRLLNLIFFLTFSILLGSWWAEQELNWGGWWSWDLIEIISLNLFLFVCFTIHSKKYKILLNFFHLDFLFKFIVYFFIVRFNFLTSIHNFISNNFFFQYVYLFLLLYFFIFYFLFKLKYFNFTLYKESYKYNFIFFIFFVLLITFSLYLYLEFFSLLFYNLNVVDIFKKNKYVYVYIVYFFIFINCVNFNTVTLNILFINAFELYYLTFILKIYNAPKKLLHIYYFHLLIYFSIYVLFLNFYYIDISTNFKFKFMNLNLNGFVFINDSQIFINNFTTNTLNHKDFIFSKNIFFYKNTLIEFFSFNNFLSNIVNINIFFYLSGLINFYLYGLFWKTTKVYF